MLLSPSISASETVRLNVITVVVGRPWLLAQMKVPRIRSCKEVADVEVNILLGCRNNQLRKAKVP